MEKKRELLKRLRWQKWNIILFYLCVLIVIFVTAFQVKIEKRSLWDILTSIGLIMPLYLGVLLLVINLLNVWKILTLIGDKSKKTKYEVFLSNQNINYFYFKRKIKQYLETLPHPPQSK